MAVEGHGDVAAIEELVRRLMARSTYLPAPWDVFLDRGPPLRIGGISALTGRTKNQDNWLRHIRRAGGRAGGILVVLDGDADFVEGRPFCPFETAALLVDRAREAGAGSTFSLACVFAMKEYEAWLAAGVESLAGKPVEGFELIRHGVTAPSDLNVRRGWKEWLRKQCGQRLYTPTIHQLPLTRMLDLDLVLSRNCRSFLRLASAIDRLIVAIRTGTHIASPAKPNQV